MNVFEFVVATVLITTIGKIIQARYGSTGLRLRTPFRGHGLMAGETDDGEARRLREEVRTLKERIAVLERLATDDNGARQLDREIEALRDKN